MKTCTKCGNEHSIAFFHKHSGRKDGLAAWCKICVKINSKRHYDNTPAEVRLQKKRLYQENNRKSVNHYNNEWRKANPEKHAAKEAKRRASKLSATPLWLSGTHMAHIKRVYKLSSLMEEITGVKHHVDHIVPLQGKNVCGLHVPWNLQVIPAKDNLKKSNNFEG